MKKGTTNKIAVTGHLDSIQNVLVAIDNLLYSSQETHIPNFVLGLCNTVKGFNFITILYLPWGCRWLTPSVRGVNKVVLPKSPLSEGGVPTVIPPVTEVVLRLPRHFVARNYASEGNLAKEIWISDISNPNTWKVVKIKNIYLCLSISARVSFGYWIRQPIAGQKLALISLAGFFWPHLPKHGNGSFVVIERKQNPLPTVPSCCRHLKIFIREDSHMNCT